jgi:hypothetical protein
MRAKQKIRLLDLGSMINCEQTLSPLAQMLSVLIWKTK